jgi:hypothetical protein
VTQPGRIVEVIFPRSARHLAPIAARIEAKVTRDLEELPAAAVTRLAHELAAEAQEREAYERFRRGLGIE